MQRLTFVSPLIPMSVPCNLYKTCLITILLLGFGRQWGFAQPGLGQHISVKPTTDFDQRFYYVPGEIQNVWGYRAGVLINDKYKLGMGAYYMDQFTESGPTVNPLSRTSADPQTINKKLYLATIYYEPYLLRRTIWETSLVFESGYGRTVNTSIDETNKEITDKKNAAVIPAGVGLSVNLKLPALLDIECFRWIGINAMVGYRAMILQQDKQYNYNGAYWSISGAIFLDRVFEDFHKWKKQRSIARNHHSSKLSY